MVRRVVGKAMWVGRATVFMMGLALMLALVFGMASSALGANGDNFILGVVDNSATAITKLTGDVPGKPALQVVNPSTAAGSKALQLNVAQNKAPLAVNPTAGKATNLDADELDGKDSTAFYAAGSKVADSELLDGKDSTDFAAAYKRTVVVAPVGSDTPIENGQALLDALSNITDATDSKPYLLYIEPGTYDLADGSLTMKPWVDIVGSGELNTVITSGVNAGSCSIGTVNGADNSELRFLTARNTGAGPCQAAISNGFAASLRLTHVTAEATGVSEGANWAVYNANSSPTLTDVTATASGSTFDVGVYNEQAGPTIRQSVLSGSHSSLQQVDGTAKVALTQLVGQVAVNGGTLQCFNNYNANMAAVRCP